MSYILEALKKSERERKKEGVPNLQADHSLPLSHRPGHKPLAKWLTGAVVLLFFGAGGWFWWQGQEKGDQPLSSGEQQVLALTSAIAPPPVIPQVSMVSESFLEPVGPAPEIQKKIFQEVRQAVPEVRKQKQAVPVPVVAEAAPVIPEEKKEQVDEITNKPLPEEHIESAPSLFEELPPQIRNGIPELSFAGHAYGDNAGKRLIIINNRIVREGAMISNGLYLEQITRDGVIMRYKALVFRMKLF